MNLTPGCSWPWGCICQSPRRRSRWCRGQRTRSRRRSSSGCRTGGACHSGTTRRWGRNRDKARSCKKFAGFRSHSRRRFFMRIASAKNVCDCGGGGGARNQIGLVLAPWQSDNDKNMTLSIMTLEVLSVIHAEYCVSNVMLSVITTLLSFVIILPKVATLLSA